MRRQIRNRGIRFARGATGPYANKLKNGVKARAATLQRGGNIWTDNPDSVGAGWTDNGDGTYTSDGTDNAIVIQNVVPGILLDGKGYRIAFEITGYVAGFVIIQIYGQDDAGRTVERSDNGYFTENVVINLTSAATPNRIVIRSFTTFTGTVGKINVRRLQ